MTKDLRLSADFHLGELSGSLKNLTLAAAKFEVSLGDHEYSGNDTNEADSAWAYFFAQAIPQLEAHESIDHSQYTPEQMKAGLMDNYIRFAVNAALYPDNYAELPLIAWAGYNKYAYQGWKDEISVVRLLLTARFDPNIPDEEGYYPLHYMAYWRNSPYSHPRGVRLLLAAGADIDPRNPQGDTPLCLLSGSNVWNAYTHTSAIYLLEAGADPNAQSGDGATPLSLMKQAQDNSPNDKRAELIAAIEAGSFN